MGETWTRKDCTFSVGKRTDPIRSRTEDEDDDDFVGVDSTPVSSLSGDPRDYSRGISRTEHQRPRLLGHYTPFLLVPSERRVGPSVVKKYGNLFAQDPLGRSSSRSMKPRKFFVSESGFIYGPFHYMTSSMIGGSSPSVR